MRVWMMLSIVCLASTLAFGCGGDDEHEELPEVDCGMGDVPTYDEVEAFAVCGNCHNSALSGDGRAGAPEDDNFDTWEGAEEEATEIAEEVFEGKMPPPDSGLTLTDAQKDQLYKWALCGAPQ